MISFTPAFLLFLKRYSLLILILILIGNLIVWNNRKDKKTYFEYTIKAKVRTDFYDPTRTLFEKMVRDYKDSTSNKLNLIPEERLLLKNMEVSSYRNEDIYYVELNLFFSDTFSTSEIITKTERYI